VKLWIAGLVFVSLAGCKQGLGERCQVDSDCAEGNCSQAEPKVCGGDNASQLDAFVPDAAIDAPADGPVDAAVDGPIDAR
jgi:hypothetical protein